MPGSCLAGAMVSSVAVSALGLGDTAVDPWCVVGNEGLWGPSAHPSLPDRHPCSPMPCLMPGLMPCHQQFSSTAYQPLALGNYSWPTCGN